MLGKRSEVVKFIDTIYVQIREVLPFEMSYLELFGSNFLKAGVSIGQTPSRYVFSLPSEFTHFLEFIVLKMLICERISTIVLSKNVF